MIKRIKHFSIFTVLLLVTTFCSAPGPKQANTQVLNFAISTREEDPTEAGLRMGYMKEYLENELGIKVNILLTNGYATVIEALKSNKVDIANMGCFSYIIAADKADVEAIAIRGTLDGNIEPYSCEIITASDSKLHSMDDVKRLAKQLTFSFGDPASTSGHLIPRAYLESIGLYKESFKEVFFSEGHSATLLTVKSGKTDVGCVSDQIVTRSYKKGLLHPSEIRVLWKSPPILNGAICVKKSINTELKKKIQKALIDFRIKEPVAWHNYASYYGTTSSFPIDSLRYIEASDSLYNGLRKIAKHFNIYEFAEK